MANRTLSQPVQQDTPATLETIRRDVETEMAVATVERGYANWTGSLQQLRGEGLLPMGWSPGRDDTYSWRAGRLEFRLERRKPATMTQREWRASDRDHWQLHCSAPGDRGTTARIHAAKAALQRELWLASPAAMLQLRQLCIAAEDRSFQEFLRKIGARPPCRHANGPRAKH